MLKKLATLAFLFPFLMTGIHAQETYQMKTWFQYTNHDSLTISKSERVNQKPVTTVIKITDPKYIDRLTKIISELPVDAKEIMISFARDVEHLKLAFCNDKKECDGVHFYGEGIKTPNTGFYVDYIEKAVSLGEEIRNLFTPKFDAAIPAVVGFEFPFPDFNVVYLGEEHNDPAPVTISVTTDIFRIIPKAGDEFQLQITSGQNSPQSTDFTVGKNKYTLIRYELTPGFQLYPEYFAITKK